MKGEDFRLIFEKALTRCSRLFGYELKPILSHQAEPIDILSLAIRDLMAQEKDIFFVQIGAHDGLSYDPIAPFVRQHHWRGLLIEPQPAVFAKLKEHYAEVPTLIFENVAIAEEEGSLTLYCFKNASPDDHASMLASTKKHYLQLNGDNERGEVIEIKVPAVNLNTLLNKHGITRVDLLQIDTEGYDFNIIRSLDFSRIKPRIIHFENNFLTSHQKDLCAKLFAAQGYAVMDLGIDTLAYLQPKDVDFSERMTRSKVVPA